MSWCRRSIRVAGCCAVVLFLATGGGSTNSAARAAAEQVAAGDVGLTARAAVVVDAASGALLYAHRPFDALPPASLTKMVTALVAVERGDLDQSVAPHRLYDVEPVLIGIAPGDSLRLEDALYGLLLNSGNDAGMAIAESVGQGSISRFVGWMNDLSSRLGLSQTHFLNPHGLDQDGHVSSAYDMAIIGRAVVRQPVLARIVGERRRVVEGPPRWLFQTTNPLLGMYAGLDGLKTGYDTLAGYCLAATAVRDGRRAISVVLNSSRTSAETTALLDAAFADPDWGADRGEAATVRPITRPRSGMLRTDIALNSAGPRSVYRAARSSSS